MTFRLKDSLQNETDVHLVNDQQAQLGYILWSRALTRVTIQKIKSLGVLQFEFYVVKGGATNRDMSLTETC